MIFLVGDSHTELMNFINCENMICDAASAKGLNNINSIKKYGNKIIKQVVQKQYSILFFHFGSVDVDFGFIYNLINNKYINSDYPKFVNDVLNNYLEFILNNFLNYTVIIMSIPLPTLDDNNYIDGIIKAQRIISSNTDINLFKNKLVKYDLPDIYERTRMSQYFNEQLFLRIRQINMNHNNIKYFDITSFTYDDNLKRVKDIFFTKNDHHNLTPRNIYINEIINNYLTNIQ